MQSDPKPPADLSWVETEMVSDGAGAGAIYGVALIALGLIVAIAILLWPESTPA
jgi:hypothetical protein